MFLLLDKAKSEEQIKKGFERERDRLLLRRSKCQRFKRRHLK